MAKRAKKVRLKWELHTIVGSALVAKKLCDLLVEEGLGRFVGDRFEFYHANLRELKSTNLRMNSTLTYPLQRYLNILIAGGVILESDYRPQPESLVKLVKNAAGCSLDRLPNDRRFKEEWFAKKTSKDISFPLSGAKEGKLLPDVFQALDYLEQQAERDRSTFGIINGNSIFNLLTQNKYLRTSFEKFLGYSSKSWIIAVYDVDTITESSKASFEGVFGEKKNLEQTKYAESVKEKINDRNKGAGKSARIGVVKKDYILREGIYLGDWCAILYAPVGTVSLDSSFFHLHPIGKLSWEEQNCIYGLRAKFRGKNAARRI